MKFIKLNTYPIESLFGFDNFYIDQLILNKILKGDF